MVDSEIGLSVSADLFLLVHDDFFCLFRFSSFLRLPIYHMEDKTRWQKIVRMVVNVVLTAAFRVHKPLLFQFAVIIFMFNVHSDYAQEVNGQASFLL